MKTTVATFLLLLIGILSFPPFSWDNRAVNDRAIRDQLPIKKYAWILGPSTQKLQLKHYPGTTRTNSSETTDALKNYSDEELERIVGIVPLHRSLALPDLAVEILIALCVASLAGLVTRGRKNRTNTQPPPAPRTRSPERQTDP